MVPLLAVRKTSSEPNSPGEIAELLVAFERQNSCRIELSMVSVSWRGEMTMSVEAVAWSGANDSGVRLRLASANVRCLEQRLETFGAVLLNLLYALDFKLAEREFQHTTKNRA